MTSEPASVFVVDDDPVLLFALKGILSTAGHRVEAFDHPEALLDRLTASSRGCALLDLQMPGLNGLELQRAIVDRGALLPLIFVSGSADVPAAVTAMKQGAVDFLSKPIDPKELCAVVERALRKDAEAARERAAADLARARWSELSPRERDVCRLCARGLLNKQIAADLGTGESTVQAQRASALKKLGVSTLVELARLRAQVGDDS